MLRIAIIDANEKTNDAFQDSLTSIVSIWLRWEMERAGIALSDARDADLILIAYAGAVDFRPSVARALRHNKINPEPIARGYRPYCITGGSVDATPFAALSIADALVVGEGYRFVRALFAMVLEGATLETIREWIIAYPHAIERSQIAHIERDPSMPWLLRRPIEPIAEPDTDVDWSAPPPVRLDDHVVRIMASKGCWKKCQYCATTYRQPYMVRDDQTTILRTIQAMTKRGDRCQLVTNDVAKLPYFTKIPLYGKLDHQSITVDGISDLDCIKAVVATGVKIMRFGVEGISERIRQAFGKPIKTEYLLDLIATMHEERRHTHLFFIIAAPFEQRADWDEYKIFFSRLMRRISYGICRMKFTTFIPAPPAPLSRFIPAMQSVRTCIDFKYWIMGNAASRHCMQVYPRGEESSIRDYADSLAVDQSVIRSVIRDDQTIDLAPTIEHAARMPHEIIKWPLSVEKRWRMSESYRKRMTEREAA